MSVDGIYRRRDRRNGVAPEKGENAPATLHKRRAEHDEIW